MDERFFKPAGELGEVEKPAEEVVNIKRMKDYFKPAGDVVEPKNMDELFRIPVEKEEIKNKNGYFQAAGDLQIGINEPSRDYSIQEIEDYLLTIVSGERISESKFGSLSGEGRMIVSFDRLKDMVNNGYNIVKAQCINPNMISIEFQEFRKDIPNGKMR